MKQKLKSVIRQQAEDNRGKIDGQGLLEKDSTEINTTDTFTILVMGPFDSGKSTLINTLIGERLFPTHEPKPASIITELKYADEKKIIMYPKKSTDAEGKGYEPFTVTDFKNTYEYFTPDYYLNNRDYIGYCGFDKIELLWPLYVLNDGMTFVRCPATFEFRDINERLNDYMLKADVVIYVINSTHPYHIQDKETLEYLNAIGIQNIIFAYTFWAQVVFDGEKALINKMKKYYLDNALKYTNLGEYSIHFLSSCEGLLAWAHIERNQEMWIKSGYHALENFLTEYRNTIRRECELSVKNGESIL